jgi:outer membrane immunogenic protein
VFGYDGRFKTDGFIGGGQVGCDHQYGAWVFGVVADFSWTDQKRKSHGFDIVPEYYPTLSNDEFASVSLKYFGTARARLGFAQGPWLFYGTGGLAWARAEASVKGEAFFPRRVVVCVAEAVECNGSSTTPFAVSDTAFHVGWAAGLGFEWMFHPNWTFGVEYLHLDFGEANYRFVTDFPNTTTALALGPGTSFKLTSDIIRATVNWRFGRP